MSAVIFMEGFDYYTSANAATPTMTLASRWAYTTSAPSNQIDVVSGRFSGGQALYMNKTASGQDKLMVTFANSSTQYTVGFAHKQDIMPSSDQLWISFYQSSVPGTSSLDFYITSTGAIKVMRGAAVLGTSVATLSSSWQYVEISIVAAALGSVTIFVDGLSKLALTNVNNINAGTGILNSVQFVCSQTSTYYIDDMYVTSNTTMLGDSRISVLTPESDTATVNWSVYPPSLSNHVSAVNGVTPDYTSYVYTNLANIQDLYNFTDLNFTPSAVYAIQPVFAARKDESATKSLRMDIVTNSSTYTDSSQSLTQSTTTFYRMEGTILNTNPVTTQNWTVSDLNNIQMGPETT